MIYLKVGIQIMCSVTEYIIHVVIIIYSHKCRNVKNNKKYLTSNAINISITSDSKQG